MIQIFEKSMDYESFKEKFVEDLKDRLDEQGVPNLQLRFLRISEGIIMYEI